MDYREFIASKQRTAKPLGFTPGAINPKLFAWQREVVEWCCTRGRAAIFAECGLGKTPMQLEWANRVCRHTGGNVILHCPVGVRHQTLREAAKFGIDSPVNIVNTQADVKPGISLVNYEKLHHFDPSLFTGVVLDECFPAGTKIDTPFGQYDIETLRVGDMILNASGVDDVSSIHTREVKYAVAFTAGKRITTSPNHPVFTERGWVCAQDLEPGDCVLQTGEAVRILRNDIPPSSVSLLRTDEVLREILLSEMEDEATAVSCECSQSGSGCEAWSGTEQVVGVGIGKGKSRDRENPNFESYDQAGSACEGVRHTQGHEPRTFRTWRERKRYDDTTVDHDGCVRRWLGIRLEHIVGFQDSRLSNVLQSRLREQRNASGYRSGWKLPSQSEGSGRKEGCKAGFVRVERLEILEPGHSELERLRSPDGKLYFYDIEATRHPSFSVEGLLVHNSSVLKSFTGVVKRTLMEAYSVTPYRLCCTATPAPNDLLELGNHADFLGVMPSNEMISRWFINDTMKAGGYRLRGHGQSDFWHWVASWAVCMSVPSDIGHPDDGFILPPLRIHRHVVEPSEREPEEGFLFRLDGLSATTMHDEKRHSVRERAEKVAELVAEHTDVPWINWCDTNYEADELLRCIPGAVDVRGTDSETEKERKLHGFSLGDIRVLISKPTVAGFGMNWQHCHNVTFVGLTYSYEQFYQAIRRTWRFGQTSPVDAHIVSTPVEEAMSTAVAEKQRQHESMKRGMVEAMRKFMANELHKEVIREGYHANKSIRLPEWLTSDRTVRRAELDTVRG